VQEEIFCIGNKDTKGRERKKAGGNSKNFLEREELLRTKRKSICLLKDKREKRR